MSELVNQRARRVLSPEEGERVWLRKLGIRFMIGGEETQGNFVLAERHGLTIDAPSERPTSPSSPLK